MLELVIKDKNSLLSTVVRRDITEWEADAIRRLIDGIEDALEEPEDTGTSVPKEQDGMVLPVSD